MTVELATWNAKVRGSRLLVSNLFVSAGTVSASTVEIILMGTNLNGYRIAILHYTTIRGRANRSNSARSSDSAWNKKVYGISATRAAAFDNRVVPVLMPGRKLHLGKSRTW